MNRSSMNKQNISYGDFRAEGGKVISKIQDIISKYDLKNICDVGGGANPLLSEEYVVNNDLDYTLFDISQEELDKAPLSFHKFHANILARGSLVENRWDLITTCALAEHVESGKQLHENIYYCLKPGGYAFHALPTLFAAPFVANVLLPEQLTSFLMDKFVPRDRYQNDKFPAYYSWCSGPTPKMMSRLQEIGYEIIDYQGLFGHRYYRRIPVVDNLNIKLSNFLLKHPTPYWTSYAHVLLRKP